MRNMITMLCYIKFEKTANTNNYPSIGSTARDRGLFKLSVIIFTIYSPSRLLAIIRLEGPEVVTNMFCDIQSTAKPSGLSRTEINQSS